MHEEPSTANHGNGSKIGMLSLLSFINRIGFGMNSLVLPLYALAIGQDEAFYGIMIASAGYVQAIVLFPAGTISDKRGRGISIFIGGLVSGSALIFLGVSTDVVWTLALYAATGIGQGFMRTSIDSLIADHTTSGDERTRSYGYTIAFATLAGTIGPLFAGYILDPLATPWLDWWTVRFAIVMFFMGGTKLLTGLLGLYAEYWLKERVIVFDQVIEEDEIETSTTAEDDLKTALLFGLGQAIMGFSSGMVIPYMIPWINATYETDPFILGILPSLANLTLASGTLFVGLNSERVGKIRMIGLLYLLAPILTIGLVYTPFFLVMAVFYVIRMAVANMASPATNSLYMSEISMQRRGRTMAVIRILWTFPRQTGTLFTAILLSIGFFGGITPFGILMFPIAMTLYPVSVIPMYIAVRRNRMKRAEEATSAQQLSQESSEEGLEF